MQISSLLLNRVHIYHILRTKTTHVYLSLFFLTALSSVATDVESNIHEIMDLLENEAKQEAEFQKIFGKRRVNHVLEEIEKECKKYEEGLTKASLSNQELHKAMNTHISNLRLLSGPLEELQSTLPSVELERCK